MYPVSELKKPNISFFNSTIINVFLKSQNYTFFLIMKLFRHLFLEMNFKKNKCRVFLLLLQSILPQQLCVLFYFVALREIKVYIVYECFDIFCNKYSLCHFVLDFIQSFFRPTISKPFCLKTLKLVLLFSKILQ